MLASGRGSTGRVGGVSGGMKDSKSALRLEDFISQSLSSGGLSGIVGTSIEMTTGKGTEKYGDFLGGRA